MEIEKAIHQEKFESDFQKAVINIHYTSSWLSHAHGQVFKAYDLSMQQFNILRILRGQFPASATVNLLIERMIDKSSNASRIVEKLRQKGLVKRKVCKDDRRKVDVIITETGLELVEKASSELRKIQDCFNALTAEEYGDLNALLDKMRSKNVSLNS